MNRLACALFSLSLALASAEEPTKPGVLLSTLGKHLRQFQTQENRSWPGSLQELTDPAADAAVRQLMATGYMRGGLYLNKAGAGPADRLALESFQEVLKDDAPLIWFHSRTDGFSYMLTVGGEVLPKVDSMETFWDAKGEATQPPEHYLTLLVRDQENQAVSQAKVSAQRRQHGFAEIPTSVFYTNDLGEAKIYVGPDRSPELLVELTKLNHFSLPMALPAEGRAAKKRVLFPKAPQLGGKVVGAAGVPVVGAKITATIEESLPNGKLRRHELPIVYADAHGQWQAPIPTGVGEVSLCVEHERYFTKQFFLEPELQAADTVRLGTLIDQSALLTLVPTALLQGTFQDAEGQPVGEVAIHRSLRITRTKANGSSTSIKALEQLKANAHGCYEMRLPPEGVMTIYCEKPSFHSYFWKLPDGSSDLKWDLTLKAARPLSILVVDAAGQPVPDCLVEIYVNKEEARHRAKLEKTDHLGLTQWASPPEPKDGSVAEFTVVKDKQAANVQWPCLADKRGRADVVLKLGKR